MPASNPSQHLESEKNPTPGNPFFWRFSLPELCSNACFPRQTFSMITRGSAVHMKGLGSSLVSASERLMAAWRSTIPLKTPRLSRCGVSFYVLSTGCQWQALPKDLPPKSTAHSYFMLWDWDGTLGGSITHSMSRPASAKDARRARRPRSLTARAPGPLKRMARPVGKQFPRANLSNLHQRIRSQGRTLAKMEIRAPRA